MRTLGFSIAAAATLAAATLTFALTIGKAPAGCPDPSEQTCCDRSEDTERESSAAALPGALAERADEDKQQALAPASDKAEFSVEGMFVDCCSCRPPCPCEVTEVAAGCKGVGVHHIRTGNYAGDELVGVKIAHAKVVGQWVNLYIDAKDEKQLAAAEKFGRAAFAKFGPITEVKAARIDVFGTEGRHTVTVDGGKIMRFETEPVLGGDGRTPVGYTNIKNAVNPTVFQGTCTSATYSDGDKKVTVDKGRNSHFNPTLKSSGKI